MQGQGGRDRQPDRRQGQPEGGLKEGFMKIRVLVDNNTLIDRYFVGEPAVCYYIEMDGMRILFDTDIPMCSLRMQGPWAWI